MALLLTHQIAFNLIFLQLNMSYPIGYGSTLMTQYLLDVWKCELVSPQFESDSSTRQNAALCSAIFSGNIDFIRHLISHGFDVQGKSIQVFYLFI